MTQLSDDFFDKWDHIIMDVDKTSVPLECIKRIRVKLKNNRQRTINLLALRKKGLSYESIEEIVNAELESFGDSVKSVSFFLDVESVADIVQPETDRLLNKIQ